MFRSLRFRLLLLTVMVAGVSLVAAALVSRVAVRREFQRLEHRDRGRGLETAAKLLSERARALGAAADDTALARLASWLEQDLILPAEPSIPVLHVRAAGFSDSSGRCRPAVPSADGS